MKKSRYAVLLLNGEIANSTYIKKISEKAKLIICADGGAKHQKHLSRVADVIIGDMDSIDGSRKLNSSTRLITLADQFSSDLDKALQFIGAKKISEVYVAGIFGGRIDHQMINLAVLEANASRFSFHLIDQCLVHLLKKGKHILPLKLGQTFSLLGAPSAVISLRGAQFNLQKRKITRSSLGLSNCAREQPILHIHQGYLWFFAIPFQ